MVTAGPPRGASGLPDFRGRIGAGPELPHAGTAEAQRREVGGNAASGLRLGAKVVQLCNVRGADREPRAANGEGNGRLHVGWGSSSWREPGTLRATHGSYSTVTDFARLRG
jgi:hypothetical protein